MTTPIATASPWPARCAYTAAYIFIAASGATNIAYGFSKGDSLATSIVWAGVAGAVAVVFALSWPALIRSVEAKQWSAALIALVAMLLSGAYSVTAALGSASGARANAAATETATTDARTKTQNAYDTAKAELDALAIAKPAAEIQALIETTKAELTKLPAARSLAEVEAVLRAAQRDPQRYGCAMINGSMALSCPKLDGELVRARQRERLTAKIASLLEDTGKAEQRLQEQRAAVRTTMDKASVDLAGILPGKQANSDAKALARYLAAVGLHMTPDRLNDLLVLLAVLMIETGGGLSLAIGIALSGPPGRTPAPAFEPATQPKRPPTATLNALNSPGAAIETVPAPAFKPSVQVRSERAPPVQAAEIMALVRDAGGSLRTTTRRLGVQLGRPAASVHGELRRLAGAGLITLNADSRGTMITLAAAGRPN